jgi:hypothetical protein
MKTKIPESLRLEHEELHGQLEGLTKISGKVGQAAKLVAQMLHLHFAAEEEFAIPPLGILSQLAEGELNPETKEILALTDRLKSELPKMLEEHKAIVRALDKLIEAADEENYPEAGEFAEKLERHAKTEEEVTYRTAILIGEYLKLRFNLQ